MPRATKKYPGFFANTHFPFEKYLRLLPPNEAPPCTFLPRILCSTPFAVLTYFLIWYVPPFEQGKVVWYLVFYCLFQSMQTVSMSRGHLVSPLVPVCVRRWPDCVRSLHALQCFHVPYSALTMFISHDQKERDSATAYRTSAPPRPLKAVTRVLS